MKTVARKIVLSSKVPAVAMIVGINKRTKLYSFKYTENVLLMDLKMEKMWSIFQ